MTPFWSNPDLLPSMIREKARETPKRSEEQYAETRERVQKGVREAEKHMKLNDVAADVLLYIEMNEEKLNEKLKDESLQDVAKDFQSYDAKQWGQLQQAFGAGKFDLHVTQAEKGHPIITMTVTLPEGNVQETMQLNQSLQDALVKRAVEHRRA
jgi:hypothetical protein